MKIILKLLMMIGMVVFYSCSSSQNITVKGTPGTEIYSPANTKLGVIDSAGELKVNVPKEVGFIIISFLVKLEKENWSLSL